MEQNQNELNQNELNQTNPVEEKKTDLLNLWMRN